MTTRRSAVAQALIVRALIIVALLLVGHDVMMTSAAAAHGNQFDGHYATAPMSTMSMPSDVSDHLESASAHDSSGPMDDPAPDPDDGDCGVLREAALPAVQLPALPDASELPFIGVPLTAVLSTGARAIRPSARAQTLDPQRRRALLQIYRM